MKKFLTRKILRMPMWLWIFVLLLALGGGGAWMAAQPAHASWRYGACKAFLEQYVRFPVTIDVEIGAETRSSAVIGFSDVNPFGSQQIRVFECHYSESADGRVTLSRITIDRKALPEDVVKNFDAMLPLLAVNPDLDTALPKDVPENIADLKD